MKKIVLTLVTGFALMLNVAPANAAPHNHFGESARTVAKEIGCKKINPSGGVFVHRDAVTCRLKGKKVTLLTFDIPAQQEAWNANALMYFNPGHAWGNGEGAVVTADNGNKKVARIAARRLPGIVRVAR